MTQLDKLKVLLGIQDNSKDMLLDMLLGDAAEDLMAWCNRPEIPSGLESAQRQLAVIRYNMMGIEGQTSHSEGGVSRAFEELPASLRATIAQYRLAKAVRSYALES